MLKHLLISPFALLTLWTSQMSTQIIAMSDLGDTLMMMQGLEANMMLLKMWFFLIKSSTMFEVIGVFVFS